MYSLVLNIWVGSSILRLHLVVAMLEINIGDDITLKDSINHSTLEVVVKSLFSQCIQLEHWTI